MTIKDDKEVKLEFAAAWAGGNSNAIMRMEHYRVRCSKCLSSFTMSKGVRPYTNQRGNDAGYVFYCPDCVDVKVHIQTDTPQVQIRIL
jgi:hypothetical protein